MTRRLLAVHAHPDDESSKGAATYASYAHHGAQVVIVSCTGGEQGDVLNPGLEPQAMAERDIAGLRRIEMAQAQAVMSIEHRWLGYRDTGLPEGTGTDEGPTEPLPINSFATIPLDISAEPLVRIIRQLRPHVLVTYDENGGYPHPDHIRAHEISMFAWEAAADPARYPEQGPAWRIPKVYYDRIFNSHRVSRMVEVMEAQSHPDLESMREMQGWMGDRPPKATTHIPIGDFLETRDAALRSHASQVSPDSAFFFWPNDLQREAWPFEDFELVQTSVQSPLPEDDLFAGIDLTNEASA
ncbi:mycothiol conjugate amidase Mca [Salinibacterium sp. G-O1]|uniref:mycothiol conjugate amidase Mca n=1 Tax=Salinibacterium sp. G-O1 TaxID=3046208 RepID=UPI0024BB0E4D|nr:mycothiol conjugate amidase Mca [Salinibacterium sp. G-O1]MDJ0334427.1 mycothiol conjugate amidase Mca [Salinibacterium sp. G-O1]